MISCTAYKQEGLTAWHFYLVKIKVTILKMVPSLCYCVVQNLNVFLIWRICSLSFISVKLLCFLRSWHTTAMLTLLLGFLSLVSIQWVYSALKLCSPVIFFCYIWLRSWFWVLEFRCFIFPVQSDCCRCPSLLQAALRHWQEIREGPTAALVWKGKAMRTPTM